MWHFGILLSFVALLFLGPWRQKIEGEPSLDFTKLFGIDWKVYIAVGVLGWLLFYFNTSLVVFDERTGNHLIRLVLFILGIGVFGMFFRLVQRRKPVKNVFATGLWHFLRVLLVLVVAWAIIMFFLISFQS